MNYQLNVKITALTADGFVSKTRETAHTLGASVKVVLDSIQRKRESQSLKMEKSSETETVRESQAFEELDLPVDLVVHTRSPEKWLLIDRETGQTYQGNSSGSWNKLVVK